MKDDLRHVRAVCQRFRGRGLMTRDQEFAFREYLHECKESGDFGSAGGGDRTDAELEVLVREFLGLRDDQ